MRGLILLIVFVLVAQLGLASTDLPAVSERTCSDFSGEAVNAIEGCPEGLNPLASVIMEGGEVSKSMLCCFPEELSDEACRRAGGIVESAMGKCPEAHFLGPLTSKSFVCCVPYRTKSTGNATSGLTQGPVQIQNNVTSNAAATIDTESCLKLNGSLIDMDDECSEGTSSEGKVSDAQEKKCCVRVAALGITKEEEREVRVMQLPQGAEVRLLQLKRSIRRNILSGQEVLAAIKDTNPEADVAQLEQILTNMSSLVETIDSISLEGEPSELAAEFVRIKHEARTLTKLFKHTATGFFNEATLEQLRRQIRERVRIRLKSLAAKIAEAKKRYNAFALGRVMRRIGINNETLVKRVGNGTIKIGEVKKLLVRSTLSRGATNRLAAAKQERERFQSSVRKRAIQRITARKLGAVNQNRLGNQGGSRK